MAFLKPFGFWGLGALSFVDSGLFPIPPTMDLVLIGYVAANPSRVLLYALVPLALAIAWGAIPAMIPPPFPLKLFEFAAGVIEMKPLPFALAIFCGKFLRFFAVGIVTVIYGPTLIQTAGRTLHEHLGLVLAGVGAIIVTLALFVTRKIFDRRNGTRLPIEEADKTV